MRDLVASVYEDSLTSPAVDPIEAVATLDLAQFDDSFFVTPDGMAYNLDGRVDPANDRYYYIEGMKGESGTCFINNAVFDGQNIVAFFAPVKFEGEVVGVIVSVYQESTLTEVMTTNFSGEATPTYLCKPDGEIIAKAAPERPNAQYINEMFDSEDLGGDLTVEQVDKYIADGVSISFTYRTSEGVGNHLRDRSWHPPIGCWCGRSLLTSPTEWSATPTGPGSILVAGVLLAALLVIVVFMVQSRKRNKALLLERQAATRIIDASTNLFSSLLSVDLVDRTYEYLKSSGVRTGLPAEGSFEEFCRFFDDTIESGDTGETLAVLDPDEIARMLPSNVPFFQQECRTKDDDRWFQISVLSLTRDSQGKPTQVLVAVQDITDSKKAEIESRHALEDAFQAAEHASQAKSDFLNSMSHDIRTPMNSIMGLTAIAGMHVDDPERVRECLANITSASRHLLGLINEVLDMAKIESGTIGLSEESFELSETIEEFITIINPQHRREEAEPERST